MIVGSSIPIALLANLARVTLTGWIMYYDPRYAKGTFHTLEGILMMGFGMALLGVECRLLELLTGGDDNRRGGGPPEPVAVAQPKIRAISERAATAH